MPTYDSDEMDVFQEHLESKRFERIGAGSFRRVYQRGNVVVKVPKSEDGLCDNIIEAHAWKNLRNRPSEHGVVCAPCRLLPNGCLMMVVVDNTNIYDAALNYKVERPDWIDKLDGGQAGLYKGQWVAYDFAIDLIERHAWERALNIESEFFKTDYSRRSYKNLRDPSEDYEDDEEGIDTDNEGNCTCLDCRQERERMENLDIEVHANSGSIVQDNRLE